MKPTITTVLAVFSLLATAFGCGETTNDSGPTGDNLVIIEADDEGARSANGDDLDYITPSNATELDEVDEIIDPDPVEADEDSEASLLTFAALADTGDVVSYVEIDRYMGRWFEIATTPSLQQLSCSATEANYTFNEEQGWVDVVNRCSVGGPDGRVQEIQGRAELVDTDTQAKLNVVFFGQAAPYWVVALDGEDGDQPYRWAVVSGPGNRSMWILSRTNQLTEQERGEINAHLTARGFPIDDFIDTQHANETTLD